MNTITCDPLRNHPWNNIGGPIGLLLAGAFCSIVLVAAFGMMVFAFLILLSDYVVSPALALLCKLRP
jgi:hypothetical protein